MTPRERRLEADFHQMLSAFAGHPCIRVQPVGPMPPERYQIVYDVPGLRLSPDNEVVRVGQHVVNLYLPASYPREKPYATTLEPVFHPNFGAHICIADFWSPSQSLVDVVVQLADMLQFRLYNVRSPLNAVAARWATENVHQLPIGNLDTLPLEPTVTLLDPADDTVSVALSGDDAMTEGATS
jgi:ubiquitin-protein ligase